MREDSITTWDNEIIDFVIPNGNDTIVVATPFLITSLDLTVRKIRWQLSTQRFGREPRSIFWDRENPQRIVVHFPRFEDEASELVALSENGSIDWQILQPAFQCELFGNELFSATDSGRVICKNVSSGELHHWVPGKYTQLSSKKGYFISISRNELHSWHYDRKLCTKECPIAFEREFDLTFWFSPDGSWVTVENGYEYVVLSYPSFDRMFRLKVDDTLNFARPYFADDNSLLVLACDSGGKIFNFCNGDGGFQSTNFDSNSRLLAIRGTGEYSSLFLDRGLDKGMHGVIQEVVIGSKSTWI
jgi:hypothetical protein